MRFGKTIGAQHLAAALLLAAVFVMWAGCGAFEESEPYPDALFGHWETDAPGYEQCFMDISETSISFQTVEGTTDVNFIQKIERTQKSGGTVYDIHYENRDGDEFLLSVTLSGEGQQATLQFFNQKYLTWNKVDWTKF